MTFRDFLHDIAPAIAVLITLGFALQSWRWHRQRPLSEFAAAELASAFRFFPDRLHRVMRRGTISYRELHRAAADTRRLILAEIQRRR